MKPETSMDNMTPEQNHAQVDLAKEQLSVPMNPEAIIDSGAERYEQTADLSAIRNDVGLTSTILTPVINNASDDINTTQTANPLLASDDDLIEKEWVDRAKKIVDQTKNNPYLQEKEVSKLQVDYIKKRFGRELGAAE